MFGSVGRKRLGACLISVWPNGWAGWTVSGWVAGQAVAGRWTGGGWLAGQDCTSVETHGLSCFSHFLQPLMP